MALALDAELVATGPAGTRTIPAAEFLQGPFTTALQPDEILTEIRLRSWRRAGFVEYARIHANFAIVAVAALVDVDGDRITRAAVALAGVAPTAIRATRAERAAARRRPPATPRRRGRRRRRAGTDARAATCTRARRPGSRWPGLCPAGDRARDLPRAEREVKPWPPACTIRLTVNGRPDGSPRSKPRRLLVDFLREDLGLTGTHIGCEHGVCGTCTVLLNGASSAPASPSPCRPTAPRSAPSRAWPHGGELHPLQDEFSDKQGLQCGYCTPGHADAGAGDPRARTRIPPPSKSGTAIASNLCRCTGYQFIAEAVLAAAVRMREPKEVDAVTATGRDHARQLAPGP